MSLRLNQIKEIQSQSIIKLRISFDKCKTERNGKIDFDNIIDLFASQEMFLPNFRCKIGNNNVSFSVFVFHIWTMDERTDVKLPYKNKRYRIRLPEQIQMQIPDSKCRVVYFPPTKMEHQTNFFNDSFKALVDDCKRCVILLFNLLTPGYVE